MENDKPGLTLTLSGEDRTAILDLIESLRHANDKWTCFHCGFVTNDYKAAEAHFGERDDPEECKPLCKWWNNMTPEERGQQLQDTIQQLNAERDHSAQARTQNEGLEYQVNGHLAAITSFKPFRECTTMTQVFQVYDSMEGRALLMEGRALLAEQQLQAARLDASALRDELTDIQQLLTSAQNIIHRRNKETT